jgi:shikimate dehydrogenase
MTALKKLAVIGDPIDHSLSPKIHKIFAESSGLAISYELFKSKKRTLDQRLQVFSIQVMQG